MKILKNITGPVVMVLFLLAILNACKKDDELVPKMFLGVGESISVSNKPNEQTIDIVANLPWTVETDANWITIADKQGEKGKRVVKFAVAKNEDDQRTATIMIKATGGELVKEIKIIQESGLTKNFYVKAGATGEGTSWEDATTLAKALNDCVSGSTIFIAAGTYTPEKTITGGDPADDGDLTFEVSKYITLKGGYPQNATGNSVADPSVNKTILSGKLANGSETYHVVTVTAPKDPEQNVILNGLVISNGNAGSSTTPIKISGTDFRRDYGGGIIAGNAGLDILNCEVTGNKSQKFVSGVYIFGGAKVTIKGSKISKNVSKNNGGGMWVNDAVAYIYNSEISENESTGTAGGLHAYPNASVWVYNTTVANNKCTSYGAGIYLREKSKGVFVNCLIYGNSTTSKNGGGGVMMYDNCSADLISSTVTLNSSAGPGGGIYRRLNVNTLRIYNSIISGNVQPALGKDVDAFEADAVTPVVQSSVIAAKAYDATGNEIAGASFNSATMLNAVFVPVGSDNPAIGSGMSSNALLALGATFNPALENFISTDLKGQSRSTSIMGALVK
ncbi:parallel beta-helix repeat protein [Arcticibacter tournemirensis]|uniref:BACON domain-containing protein n=1 Tax=Arcticibacter tournemirensis TaxID=699437 RepID=A0A5M9HBX5_9SPHI|nr:BACON domain-containing carbohydrate-binding protein [Arcticibacter tournemirensis]KAA8484456.1 hypothetical protein F1649_06705 [Arcticibacter tournemirensis]TQM49903.1 parallel beta-helix repeat protein [Arcticibacter tournemirensis]